MMCCNRGLSEACFLHFYGPDLQSAASASWRSLGLIGRWLRSEGPRSSGSAVFMISSSRERTRAHEHKRVRISVSVHSIYTGVISLVVTVKPSRQPSD